MQRDRHGTTTSYQLVLVTPEGEAQVLRNGTALATLVQAADGLDAAIRSGATEFRAEVSPAATFWLGVALLVLFAGTGIMIASLPQVRQVRQASQGRPR